MAKTVKRRRAEYLPTIETVVAILAQVARVLETVTLRMALIHRRIDALERTREQRALPPRRGRTR